MGYGSEATSRFRSPQFIVAGFLLVTVAMGYYIMSYSWENKDLLNKYTSTMWKLKKTTTTLGNTERKLKLCKASEKSFSIATKELQQKVSTQEAEMANLNSEKTKVEHKFERSRKFFVDAKGILGKSDDPSFYDTSEGGVSDSTYSALKDLLNSWKDDRKEHSELKFTHKEAIEHADNMRRDNYLLKESSSKAEDENKILQGKITTLEEQVDRLQKDKESRGMKRKQGSLVHENSLRIDMEDKRIVADTPIVRATKEPRIDMDKNRQITADTSIVRATKEPVSTTVNVSTAAHETPVISNNTDKTDTLNNTDHAAPKNDTENTKKEDDAKEDVTKEDTDADDETAGDDEDDAGASDKHNGRDFDEDQQ